MKNIVLLLTVLFFAPLFIYSQSPATVGVPFLTWGPSGHLGGHIGASSVLQIDDTFGAYYNPAQLGVFSRKNNFSIQFYPQKINWLPNFSIGDYSFESKAFIAGYILKDLYREIDVNVGIGYSRILFDLGKNVYTDDRGNELGIFNSHESSDAYSIGFGIDYFANFSFGYTYKKINSNLVPIVVEHRDGRADASAHDFGMMVEVPILDDHLNNSESAIFIGQDISLFSKAYLGYAQTNSGDMISYGDESQPDPLPKMAKLGIGFSIGLLQEMDFATLKLIELEVGQEAQDYLVNRTGIKASYQSGLGDIELFDNFLLGNQNEDVQINRTVRVNIYETFSLGLHHMKTPWFKDSFKNRSFTFSTRYLFKFLASGLDGSFFEALRRLDIRYSQSEIDAPNSAFHETEYKSISINLHGLFE